MSDKKSMRVIDPWLLSVALIWGGNFVCYKLVLEDLPPFAIIGARFVLTAPLLLVAARLFSTRPPPERKDWPALVWAGVAVLGVQQVTFIVGMDLTTASEAAIMIATAPIFTAIIGAVSGRERLTPLNWLGILLGLLGVAMVALGGKTQSAALPHRLAGVLVMMFSAFLFGYFMVLSGGMVRRHGGLRAVAYCYCLGALVIVPVSAHALATASWGEVGALSLTLLVGYICLLASVYGFTVWCITIGRTTAASTAVYQFLVPVVAMVAAALFLGERPGPVQLAGAGAAIAGLVLARWRTSPAAGAKPLAKGL